MLSLHRDMYLFMNSFQSICLMEMPFIFSWSKHGLHGMVTNKIGYYNLGSKSQHISSKLVNLMKSSRYVLRPTLIH